MRVSSNRSVIPLARTPRECLELLREMVAVPNHQFWNDDTSLARTRFLEEERLVGCRQVTDAHLLALALRRRGCLATLDRGVRQLVPLRFDPDRVVACLIR